MVLFFVTRPEFMYIDIVFMSCVFFGCILIGEFALLRMLTHTPNGRCVYMAPSDAVAQDRFDDWNAKFGAEGLGKEVVLLTGEATDLKLLAKGKLSCAVRFVCEWSVL